MIVELVHAVRQAFKHWEFFTWRVVLSS